MYTPPGIAVAVAAILPVPLPLSVNDNPDGRLDAVQPPTGVESLNAGAGVPDVVTGKLPAVPDVNVAEFAARERRRLIRPGP